MPPLPITAQQYVKEAQNKGEVKQVPRLWPRRTGQSNCNRVGAQVGERRCKAVSRVSCKYLNCNALSKRERRCYKDQCNKKQPPRRQSTHRFLLSFQRARRPIPRIINRDLQNNRSYLHKRKNKDKGRSRSLTNATPQNKATSTQYRGRRYHFFQRKQYKRVRHDDRSNHNFNRIKLWNKLIKYQRFQARCTRSIPSKKHASLYQANEQAQPSYPHKRLQDRSTFRQFLYEPQPDRSIT